MKTKNEEIRSRRQFFKQAAKAILPVLGIIALNHVPLFGNARETQIAFGCQYYCQGGCKSGCNDTCKITCNDTCKGSCYRSCQGNCDRTCYGACTGGNEPDLG